MKIVEDIESKMEEMDKDASNIEDILDELADYGEDFSQILENNKKIVEEYNQGEANKKIVELKAEIKELKNEMIKKKITDNDLDKQQNIIRVWERELEKEAEQDERELRIKGMDRRPERVSKKLTIPMENVDFDLWERETRLNDTSSSNKKRINNLRIVGVDRIEKSS